MVMSDRIAVMNQGRIEQIGAPNEIYDRPRTRFAAEFLGSCNLIHASVLSGNRVKTPWGEWRVEDGAGILLTIRPENIRLGAPGEFGNHGQGKITEVVYNGSQTYYELESNGH